MFYIHLISIFFSESPIKRFIVVIDHQSLTILAAVFVFSFAIFALAAVCAAVSAYAFADVSANVSANAFAAVSAYVSAYAFAAVSAYVSANAFAAVSANAFDAVSLTVASGATTLPYIDAILNQLLQFLFQKKYLTAES